METTDLIEELGYSASPHFLPFEKFGEVPEHAQVFRKAFTHSSVQGVYLLRDDSRPKSSSTPTPVVYVAQAETETEAAAIHKRVWNQNIVPFLIVRTPKGIRLYSGFSYDENLRPAGEREGVLAELIQFHEVSVRLAAFRASAIDDGQLWRTFGEKVNTEGRVDLRLLDNLEALGQWLRAEGVGPRIAHSLIGKLVYLRYLRDRDILSDWRLEKWRLDPEKIFSRSPSLGEIQRLVEHLEGWLNGEIFPLQLSGEGALCKRHVEYAAGVFLGDEALTGQRHLDFKAYDFSNIPIETLSTIYEQFLALEGKSRQKGAYYTPIPLVNFMLAELDDNHPLRPGMRILDPACGSGTFLVQCFRRLIERQRREIGRKLKPTELREILVGQIFGVDSDPDACRVAELSLILTMLDYVDPPDLQGAPTFKLPRLHDTNVFKSDFFDPESCWAVATKGRKYDWIVGNPPWIEATVASEDNGNILRWIAKNKSNWSVTDNQTAEAFAWEATTYLAPGGVVGLLLPAMTLFKNSTAFRRAFFDNMNVLAIVNLANFRRDLFVKRVKGKSEKMEIAVAAIIYRAGERASGDHDTAELADRILVYSPLLVNHESNRPETTENRRRIWSLMVNASEVSIVDRRDVLTGESPPWKVAMWGTFRDNKLLRYVSGRFDKLALLEEKYRLKISEGVQLREKLEPEGLNIDLNAIKKKRSGKQPKPEALDPVPEVVGKKRLLVKMLHDVRDLHAFPADAFDNVQEFEGFIRRRGGKSPLDVLMPPHVIVSAARAFAVYSDDYMVIPPRQIGIAGSPDKAPLLKALALYLSSDFAKHFEFFKSPQWGIREGRSTLDTLRALPTPFLEIDDAALREWCELHRQLVRASEELLRREVQPLFSQEGRETNMRLLTEELNRKVERTLGISETQHWLIHDLVHVKMQLSDGKLGEPAVRSPSNDDLEGYGTMLRDELDAFLDDELGLVHRIQIWNGRVSGVAQVELVKRNGDCAAPVSIHDNEDAVTRELERLRKQHDGLTRQWLYFDRNLFVYDREKTFIFKPSQRLWWTRSQAMSDADEIIAAALAPKGGS